jgi:hypothetical protein
VTAKSELGGDNKNRWEFKKWCITIKLERIKMVVGHDVRMEDVYGLFMRAFASWFMGKFIKYNSLRGWLEGTWVSILGYIPTSFILVRG